jgi:3-aminobutyryl-CoA ammonia-lyase
VQFRAPVRAGDVLEVTARVVKVGRRSRTLELRAEVVGRGRPDVSESAAEMLAEPIVATTATGVVVVPPPR